MKFYPHGGSANFIPYLQSSSLSVSASFLYNPNKPIFTASLALSAPPQFTGPSGSSGSNQTVTGPQGVQGPDGGQGPRGRGSYTGSLTTVICCTPYVDTVCVGVDLYTYDNNCQQILQCLDYIGCGGTNSACA